MSDIIPGCRERTNFIPLKCCYSYEIYKISNPINTNDQHDGKLSKREQNVYLNSLINKI